MRKIDNDTFGLFYLVLLWCISPAPCQLVVPLGKFTWLDRQSLPSALPTTPSTPINGRVLVPALSRKTADNGSPADVAFVESCKGMTSAAGLQCPCAGIGQRCADPASVCNARRQCVCDDALAYQDSSGTRCIRYPTTTPFTCREENCPPCSATTCARCPCPPGSADTCSRCPADLCALSTAANTTACPPCSADTCSRCPAELCGSCPPCSADTCSRCPAELCAAPTAGTTTACPSTTTAITTTTATTPTTATTTASPDTSCVAQGVSMVDSAGYPPAAPFPITPCGGCYFLTSADTTISLSSDPNHITVCPIMMIAPPGSHITIAPVIYNWLFCNKVFLVINGVPYGDAGCQSFNSPVTVTASRLSIVYLSYHTTSSFTITAAATPPAG
ncbi:uncharacterized protein LOC129583004 isoform X2 [Paramacrobiotus metropolitanus]|uniref:uncharacterized protein LOC129583004 isoform X2 n=1 Tax=Paramacrobiotus metropolitanus TaxID=2943436 RepID=UPI00244580AD|nr:uncharacterized protein LOC129583004 isoform X2 [Paramacrobiotus metropolitanus]